MLVAEFLWFLVLRVKASPSSHVRIPKTYTLSPILVLRSQRREPKLFGHKDNKPVVLHREWFKL